MSKINVGNCGEYFVAAELERRGFSVAVPMSNVPAFDLLIIQNNNLCNQVAIQVKTNSYSKNEWTMGKKSETIVGDNVYYVLVKLNGLGEPDYFIVPSRVVAGYVYINHQQWLNSPGKKGQKHKDNSMRKFRLNDNEYAEYKDAWHLLKR